MHQDQSQFSSRRADIKTISSETRRAVRILGRRYALTPTFYKYLEIEINVGATSYVQLVLGDNRGNQIFFIVFKNLEI
ncbi:hypothetical protein ACFW04_014676 [Cataglyphis niger]